MFFTTSPLLRDGYDISVDESGKIKCVCQYWSNGANIREYKPEDKQFNAKLQQAFVVLVSNKQEEGQKLKDSVSNLDQKMLIKQALTGYIEELENLNK